jgi:hypothetical protein
MDHIGIDVHKRESQIYILAEGGEVIERRIRTEAERFDAVLGTWPRARIVLEVLDRQRMGRPLPGGARPRGHRRGPELRADVCDPHAQGQDRPAGCARPGRGLPARGLPPRSSTLRSSATGAWPLGDGGLRLSKRRQLRNLGAAHWIADPTRVANATEPVGIWGGPRNVPGKLVSCAARMSPATAILRKKQPRVRTPRLEYPAPALVMAAQGRV